MTKINLNDKGELILTTHEKLSPKRIAHLKASLSNKIGKLVEENIHLNNQIINNERQLSKLQEHKKLLDSKEVEEYVAQEKELAQIAIKKADDLLKGYVGDEAYNQLKSNNSIVFKAKDGLDYKINPKGEVGRRVGKQYKRICIIKPADIPLSDRIIAILTSVKENPKEFRTIGIRVVR